jgi:lysophospholipase L1-like esterase
MLRIGNSQFIGSGPFIRRGSASSPSGPTYDPDFALHATAVEAAGGSFDLSAINATYTESYVKAGNNALVVSLKGITPTEFGDVGLYGVAPPSSDLWTNKLVGVYPLAGKSFAGMPVKLKGTGTLGNEGPFLSSAFTPCGAQSGLKGNSTNQYLTTGESLPGSNDFSFGVYLTETPVTTQTLMAAYGASGSRISMNVANPGTAIFAGCEGSQNTSRTVGAEFYCFSTLSSTDHRTYANGAKYYSNTNPIACSSLPNFEIFRLGPDAGVQYTNARIALAYIASGMVDSEQKYFAWCVNSWAKYFGFNTWAQSIYLLGDSTVADYSGQNNVLEYTDTELTEVALADPGDTIANQKTVWQSADRDEACVVIIQVGHNDLSAAKATSTIISDLQDLVDTVAADVPDAKILIATMTPAKQRYIDLYGATDGATVYQQWLDVNESIRGNGVSPITGVDGRVSSHTDSLNDGSGNLDAAYDTGDGIHPNADGRAINGSAYLAGINLL